MARHWTRRVRWLVRRAGSGAGRSCGAVTSHAVAGMVAVAVITAITGVSGCGGAAPRPKTASGTAPAPAAATEAWSDPSFRPSASVLLTVSLAPVPATGALADRADQGFERVFLNTDGLQIRMTPAMTRERMNGNRELVQTMNRIQSARLNAGAPGNAALKTLLSGREYEDLRAAIGDPRVFCVPVEFKIERAGAVTRGSVLYRAYEFASGRPLRQCRFTAQSPAAPEPAEQRVLVDLILAVADDFAQHFVAH